MHDNFDKVWLQDSLNQVAISRAQQEIQRTGRALPCKVISVDGSIVTVSFEVQGGPWTLPQVTLPKAESQWLRAPTQEGDFGMTVPADTFLGGVSGLGTGVADLTVQYPNLSTLVFVPLGTTAFPASPDPNKVYLNGPNGAIIASTDGTVIATFDQATQTVTINAGSTTSITANGETGLVTIKSGGQEIVIDNDPSITSTVQGSLGRLQTIVDGSGNAISTVVPAGAKVGVGALASQLGPPNAAITQAALDTFATGGGGLIQQTLPALMAAVGGALGASSSTWGTAKGALEAIFAAASFVPNIPGINPTIPSGSTTVFIKP